MTAMTAALAALQEFEHEVARRFPADGPQLLVLAAPLGELRRKIEAVDGGPTDAGPLLDLIEDLLESLLRTLGWPAGGR